MATTSLTPQGAAALGMDDFLPTLGLASQYDQYIRNMFGGNPMAMGYAASQGPMRQLQYLSNPFAPGQTMAGMEAMNAAANPFTQWLGQGNAPLDAGGWMGRVSSIANTLNNPMLAASQMIYDPMNEGDEGTFSPSDEFLRQELIRERFGADPNRDPSQTAERQRNLAFAPILANTSRGLRGEVGNILNRMYGNYMANPLMRGGGMGPMSFLNWASGSRQGDYAEGEKPASLWQIFGIPGA